MFAGLGGKKYAFKAAIGGFAAFAGYGCFYQFQKYVKTNKNWNEIQDGIDKFQPYEIKGIETRNFPWLKEKGLQQWEYKIVKIKGYFKEERFFIRRQRDGKNGYLVFAPFITSTLSLDHDENSTVNPPVENAIFVNLGWVPQENKQDIEMGSEPVPLLEAKEGTAENYFDNYTGFNQSTENAEDALPLTEIVGIVRRGESEDFLHGRRNWKNDSVFTFIDLFYMSRFFRIFNLDSASTAYLERIVPSYEDTDAELYPVPASKANFDKPLVTPRTHLNYSLFWGTTSALSLLSFLTVLKR